MVGWGWAFAVRPAPGAEPWARAPVRLAARVSALGLWAQGLQPREFGALLQPAWLEVLVPESQGAWEPLVGGWIICGWKEFAGKGEGVTSTGAGCPDPGPLCLSTYRLHRQRLPRRGGGVLGWGESVPRAPASSLGRPGELPRCTEARSPTTHWAPGRGGL